MQARLVYFGHRLRLGLPSHSGLRKLYYVPERGGFLWMTGLSLPATYLYKPWGTQQTKAISSLDTTSMLLTATLASA